VLWAVVSVEVGPCDTRFQLDQASHSQTPMAAEDFAIIISIRSSVFVTSTLPLVVPPTSYGLHDASSSRFRRSCDDATPLIAELWGFRWALGCGCIHAQCAISGVMAHVALARRPSRPVLSHRAAG
jgi:hypothetical protein